MSTRAHVHTHVHPHGTADPQKAFPLKTSVGIWETGRTSACFHTRTKPTCPTGTFSHTLLSLHLQSDEEDGLERRKAGSCRVKADEKADETTCKMILIEQISLCDGLMFPSCAVWTSCQDTSETCYSLTFKVHLFSQNNKLIMSIFF